MNVKDLRYFIMCAETGNLTRAAEVLSLNVSTLSRCIGRLESEIGFALFERGHTGIRLTAGGEIVLRHARQISAEIKEIEFVGTHNGLARTGTIRLGVRMSPIKELVRDLLADWKLSYPNVPIKIVELSDHDIVMALIGRQVDLALLPDFMLWPQAATLFLYHEPIVAVLPSSHPLATEKTLSLQILKDVTILVQGWDDGQPQKDFFVSLLGNEVRFETHPASKLSVFALVVAGYGITLATKSQSEVSFPGLVFKPIVERNAWFRVDLAWMPETEEPAIGRFVAFMRDEVRSRSLL